MTHKETRSIRDIVSDTANRKHRAAESRVTGTPPGAELPRNVFSSACASIATVLEASGYKYSKSGPHLRKRSGEFTFQVSFQSSRNNVPGEHVCLWIHGTVFSRRIKKWREAHPNLHPSEYIAGGQIGNLQSDSAWLEWELADRRNRDEAINDAVSTIRQLAFPYFALFDDLPSLTSRLLIDDLPSMTIDCVIEFLMCFTNRQLARESATNFLKRHPDLIQSYRLDFQGYAERGLDSVYPSGYAKQLAFGSHAFEFGDLTKADA